MNISRCNYRILDISEKMVSRVGLEPTTPSLRGSCSNQLSYRPDSFVILSFFAQFVQWENKISLFFCDLY